MCVRKRRNVCVGGGGRVSLCLRERCMCERQIVCVCVRERERDFTSQSQFLCGPGMISRWHRECGRWPDSHKDTKPHCGHDLKIETSSVLLAFVIARNGKVPSFFFFLTP